MFRGIFPALSDPREKSILGLGDLGRVLVSRRSAQASKVIAGCPEREEQKEADSCRRRGKIDKYGGG